MLFVFLVLLSLAQNTVIAMPLVRPAPLSLLPGPAQAEFQRTSDVDENFLGQRSLTSIIWSCFATIFACTWVVVHPNIPDESDSEWTIIGRRLKVMIYTLLVPELVLYWASKQWYAARETSRKHAGTSLSCNKTKVSQ